jgi:hypothetical protein
MRPRFSFKVLLIAFALFAVVLYALFVHPTVAANRLIRAVNAGDFSQLKALKLLANEMSANKNITFENCTIRAELKPRTWRDVFKFRRSVWVHTDFPRGQVVDNASGLVDYLTVHIHRVAWGAEP